MKLPGRAWLEFVVEGEAHQATIRQTAIFDPLGLLGLVYWYGIYPLHQLVFAGMLRGIAAAGEREQSVGGEANAGQWMKGRTTVQQRTGAGDAAPYRLVSLSLPYYLSPQTQKRGAV